MNEEEKRAQKAKRATKKWKRDRALVQAFTENLDSLDKQPYEWVMAMLRLWIRTGQLGVNNIMRRFYLRDLGIVLTLAYHCNRCDYLWFPKDFDAMDKERATRDIFNLIVPKSCARCKSKLWNKPRIRNTKPRVKTDIPNDGMITLPRMRALKRNLTRLGANKEEFTRQYLRQRGYSEEEIARIESEIKAEEEAKEIEEKIPIPIPIPNRKKKKRLV